MENKGEMMTKTQIVSRECPTERERERRKNRKQERQLRWLLQFQVEAIKEDDAETAAAELVTLFFFFLGMECLHISQGTLNFASVMK